MCLKWLKKNIFKKNISLKNKIEVNEIFYWFLHYLKSLKILNIFYEEDLWIY